MARNTRPTLTNQTYWTKTRDELVYIVRDAYEAAAAMRDHDPVAEAKYLEQMNDASTVLCARAGE